MYGEKRFKHRGNVWDFVTFHEFQRRDKNLDFVPLESSRDYEQDRFIPDFLNLFLDSFPKTTSGKGVFLAL